MANQATERQFLAVPPQNFSQNGTSDGQVSVANSRLFRVKQKVQVSSSTQPTAYLEVKFILNATTLILGPTDPSMDSRADLVSYLVADSASIQALKQPRPNIPIDKQQIDAFEYEHEPIRAKRTFMVDDLGNPWNEDNPFPVLATVEAEGMAGTPNILNVLIPDANVEQSIILPANTKQFSIGLRGPLGKLQLAFTSGQSDTNYVTIKQGNTETFRDIKLTSATIYFRCSKANSVLEILAWN